LLEKPGNSTDQLHDGFMRSVVGKKCSRYEKRATEEEIIFLTKPFLPTLLLWLWIIYAPNTLGDNFFYLQKK
jgi:hypothetical protein